MTSTIRIGTRASPLALWQARHIADLLQAAAPQIAVEFVTVETTGDLVRDRPLAQIGGDGLFTRQIQVALLDNRADVAVHSMKDLPTASFDGLTVAAVPLRGATGDALVTRAHLAVADLPLGARIATSSLRRRSQLLHRRTDLILVDIRGNVETRLRKLAEEKLDGLVLAQAGLERLGLGDAISEILDQQWMLPAVGQGALALECRERDTATREVLSKLNHLPTFLAVGAERAMLRGLGGGCQMPVGAVSTVAGETLTLRGVVLSPDGSRRIAAELSGALADAEGLGQRLATALEGQGARDLLQSKSGNRA